MLTELQNSVQEALLVWVKDRYFIMASETCLET